MAKEKFIALYPIGSKIKVGATVEIDPESKEGLRLLKAKAIAKPEDLKKAPAGDSANDDRVAELEEQNAELAKGLEEATGRVSELEEQNGELSKGLEESQARVAELEKTLEAQQAPADKGKGGK